MLGVKFFGYALSAHRSFSTRITGLNRKRAQDKYKGRYKAKEEEDKNTRVEWTGQQKQVIFAVSEGKSVFITGSAGTGKTILVKHIIKVLKRSHKPSKVFVTAPTGVAACAISGQTLHAFAGIGCAMADRDTLLERILNNKRAYWRWLNAKALVIDEISMVDAQLVENLEFIARNIRGVDEIWGGIQLVVGGDFFQLPPIKPQKNSEGKVFAFEADCWDSSFYLQVNLTKVFRQSDPQLIKLLQGIRTGESDPEDLKFLEQSCSKAEPDPSVVQLFPRIEDVNKVNLSRLESLGNELLVYTAVDSGEDSWKRQLEQGIVPKEISLCKDARVMLVKNLSTWRGLVNGATGTVRRFTKSKNVGITSICESGLLPVVKFDSGREMVIKPETWAVTAGNSVVAKREQLPLILAWASSIHKCQGMTLDRLHTNLSRAFENGMVYVALSRVRSLEGLYLSDFDRLKIKVHPKVLQFYKRFTTDEDKESEDVSGSQKNDVSNNNGRQANINQKINVSRQKDVSGSQKNGVSNDNASQKINVSRQKGVSGSQKNGVSNDNGSQKIDVSRQKNVINYTGDTSHWTGKSPKPLRKITKTGMKRSSQNIDVRREKNVSNYTGDTSHWTGKSPTPLRKITETGMKRSSQKNSLSNDKSSQHINVSRQKNVSNYTGSKKIEGSNDNGRQKNDGSGYVLVHLK